MKKRFISFLLIIVFVINISSPVYASKYENGVKIETLYNLVPIKNNKNIKVKSEEVTYNLATKYPGENGTVKTLVEMENISNKEEDIDLSLMIIASMRQFNELLVDENSRFKLNGENIDFKVRLGRLTNREYSSINPDIEIEDVYDFDEERKYIVDSDYKPSNFDLNERVYFYKLNSKEDKKDETYGNNDIEIKADGDNENFYIHNYLNFNREENSMDFTGSGEKYIVSYKKPLNNIRVKDTKLVDGNNTVINKNGNKINLNFSSVEISMKNVLELINKENLSIEIFENLLDEQLKLNKKVISIYDLSSNMERIIYLDYKVKLQPKEVARTLVMTPIDKSREHTGNKDIYFNYISNPSDKLNDIENFNFTLILGNEYNKFKKSNVKFKQIDNNTYEFKTDKLEDEKIIVNYGNKKLINRSTKISLIIIVFIILAVILLSSVILLIYLIAKHSKKSN